jgi:hypothetical protein
LLVFIYLIDKVELQLLEKRLKKALFLSAEIAPHLVLDHIKYVNRELGLREIPLDLLGERILNLPHLLHRPTMKHKDKLCEEKLIFVRAFHASFPHKREEQGRKILINKLQKFNPSL